MVSNVAGSIFSPPPERSRSHPCKRLENILSSCWQGIKVSYTHVKYFSTQTLLGRVILYAAADTVGGIVGGKMGVPPLADGVSRIGNQLVPSTLMLTSTMLLMRIKNIDAGKSIQASRITEIFLLSMLMISTHIIMLTYSSEINHMGKSIGYDLGEKIGYIVGTTLGGYAGLVLVGSPTILYDRVNPWDSYSTSNTRFLVAGMLFDAIIVKPTTPYLAPVIQIPRQLLRSLTQMFAYNSNLIMPTLMSYLRPHSGSRPSLPMTQLFLNSYCGHNGVALSKQLSQSLSLTCTSLSPHLTSIFFQKLTTFKAESLFIDPIEKLMQKIQENLPSLLMNSLLAYLQLLNQPVIQEKQKLFEERFTQKEAEALTVAIQTEISQKVRMSSLIAPIFPSLLGDIQPLLEPLINQIQHFETELIGYPLLSKRQASYLTALLHVHLPLYLTFTVSQFSEFLTPISVQQEGEFLTALNHLIFRHYVHAITPPVIARTTHKVMHVAMQWTFKTREYVVFCLQQSEQRTTLSQTGQKIEIFENYFPVPKAEELEDGYESINLQDLSDKKI